jgi:hypothetical protein
MKALVLTRENHFEYTEVPGITVNCLAPGWFKTAQKAVLYENVRWVEYITAFRSSGRVSLTIQMGR